MITNLVASIVVTLVTNTTERFPGHQGFGECPDHIPGCLVIHGIEWIPDKDPHQKWVRTRVVRRTILNFEWHGVQQSSSDEIISDTEQEFTLKRTDEWQTNRPPLHWTHIRTNSIWQFTNNSEEYFVRDAPGWTNIPMRFTFWTTNGEVVVTNTPAK